MKKKALIDVESEEEWECLANVTITNKRALESENEINFEPWFLEEVVKEKTVSVSCVVAVEEKPREGASLEIITKKNDDVAVIEKTARLQVTSRQEVNGHAICRAKDKETRRRQLQVLCVKSNSMAKLIKDIPKTRWHVKKDYKYKKYDNPDGRGVLKDIN